MTLQLTPDQTVGPFFHVGLTYEGARDVVAPGTAGSIVLAGRLLDGNGEPVSDGLVEIWQPDASGTIVGVPGSRQRPPGRFTGYGRCATDAEGGYTFTTLEPAPLRQGAAAFFAVKVFARGLLTVLSTRIYVPESPIAGDPLLASLPPERRETLIARRSEPSRLQHDIRLQGDRETVFLAFR